MRMRMTVIEVLVILLFGVGAAEGTIIDFYEDGSIESGDVYGVVRTHNDAVVDMTGGLIETYLHLYDTSIFNACGGALSDSADIVLFDSTTIHLHGLQTSTLGNMISVDSTESATINVYGYGFYYVGDMLNGYWVDGRSFSLYVRDEETMASLVFHEIPEPMTFLLLGMGGLVIRACRR